MATLHVRNVPDELYEGLRANAAVEGRSIGAQVVVLLQRALEDRRGVRERVRSRITEHLGQVRFLSDARRAVAAAQDEARELGHGDIDTGHLLLGLLREGELAELVARPPLAIGVEPVRRRMRELRPHEEAAASGRMPFSAEAKQALEAALRESLALKHRHIGPEHVLLGIAAIEDGVGAGILRDLGADRDTLRACLLASPTGPAAPSVFWRPAEREYHAVELTGSADAWTETLNRLAGEGWELVSIVPEPAPRAVFRRPGADD